MFIVKRMTQCFDSTKDVENSDFNLNLVVFELAHPCNKVVDAAAAAAGGVNAAALSKFAGAAQDAALSADAKKLGGLTGVGVKIGLSVGPGKIAAATKAATDLLLAL